MFKKAVKSTTKLRLALCGTSGSGKTMTSLILASSILKIIGGPGNESRIAVIDTENGSASKYADLFDFDVLELRDYHPENYIEAIKAAESNGYGMIIIDSLSHAWSGKGGALELNDKFTQASRSKNSFNAWAKTTPIWQSLIDSIIHCKCHIMVTMRTKAEYVITQENCNGRTISKPEKIGMAPIIREGIDYEFDIVGDMDGSNFISISKTRCSDLKGWMEEKPGQGLADVIIKWITSGEDKIAPTNEIELADSEFLDIVQTLYDCNSLEELKEMFISATAVFKKRGASKSQLNKLIAEKDTVKFKIEMGKDVEKNEEMQE